MSVYIITCNLNKKIVYVGSCANFSKRITSHKTDYKLWIKGNKTKIPNNMCNYFKEYGLDNFDFKLYKNYNYNDTKYIRSREQLLINKLRRYKCLIVVNKFDCFTPPPHQKILKKLNRYKYKKGKKLWIENNKDKTKLHNATYYKKNREKCLNKMKVSYQKRKAINRK